MVIRSVLAALLVLSAAACGGGIEGQPENCGVASCSPDDRAPAPAPTHAPDPTAPEPGRSSPPPKPASTVPTEECPAPYHVPDDDRCVWSCSEGTQPASDGKECVCQPGLVEVTTDPFGRRVCR